jgi:hypothetical protein
LKRGEPLGVSVTVSRQVERRLIDDGAGDALDAAICAVQAAWAWKRRRANYGLPADIEAGEGWIVTAA